MNIMRKANKGDRSFALVESEKSFFVCDKSGIVIRRLKITRKKAEQLSRGHETVFIDRASNYLETAHTSGLKDLSITTRF